MSIFIFSDTHGNTTDAIRVINEATLVDAIIHAGDHISDAEKIHNIFPYIPIYSVSGNCDFLGTQIPMLTFMLKGKKIFLTHGHHFGVKTDLFSLKKYSAENDIDITIFGHTHAPLIDYHGKTTIINPGSMRGYNKSYCVLNINSDKIDANIKMGL